MLINGKLNTATLIELKPNADMSEELTQFLTNGADLVKANEPDTKLWFALKKDDELFAIIDLFLDEKARQAHFDGDAAKALRDNADKLIIDGWDNGVLKNVNHFDVLASCITDTPHLATEATCIILVANDGCEDELADLLTNAAELIDQNEPNTLFWSALKLNKQIYAIYDIFKDDAAREEHFNAQAAQALKEKADDLIHGGWENGVLPNIYNYKILAISENFNN
ncbi:hypothetical protein L3V82_11815 [Thiotrichales bacterium 19S3-7]|nr:hypothetical protein [Thiotrichales bacterium 19S3-7]MCF6802900.1 hypothetical protein [Thiotrichales bacterium 19S3-11]